MADKKILFITYDGLTDHFGQSQIIHYVKALSKIGYQFTILGCEKPGKYGELGNFIQGLCDEGGINCVSLLFTNTLPVIYKINDRWQIKRKAIELQKKKGFDMMHCRGYVSAEIGLYLKRKNAVNFFLI